jgi:hypothetical protein
MKVIPQFVFLVIVSAVVVSGFPRKYNILFYNLAVMNIISHELGLFVGLI